jgi:predicted AAA+ superfamily ATPase
MWIERDLAYFFGLQKTLESVLIQGPRQVGKSSFLERYAPGKPSLALLDDLALRQLAQRDPALFLSQRSGPVIIDEFHYAPNLLPEIKLRIDAERRRRRDAPSPTTNVDPMFFLSGSNQIDIDRAVKETLAGRLSVFTMHGLSVAEALAFDPNLSTWDCLWRGGFPELYVRRELSPISYINDYISTFIEKDIARSGGVSKLEEFLTVTRLLAARVGNILNRDSVANDAGVASKTVGEWSDVLKRTHIIYLLPPFSGNLNSRLVKSPKVYFLDVGLAARLQGHLSRDAMIGSPQIGALFENLVVSEIIKTRAHRGLSYEVAFWRTRDGDEVDIVLSWPGKVLLVEAKLAIQGDVTFVPPSSVVNEFGPDVESLLVTFSGTQTRVTPHTTRLPISALADYLTMIDRMSLGLP